MADEIPTGHYILVDFNGTLAHHVKGVPVFDAEGTPILGAPVPAMIARVKRRLESGMDVRVLCASLCYTDARGKAMERAIEAWCVKHIGRRLPVTCQKTPTCWEIWDDKARRVIRNTGEFDSGASAAPGSIKESEKVARARIRQAMFKPPVT